MSSIRVLFNGEDVMSTELDKEFYVIGRQEGCEIRIDNLGVSRNHARLMHDAEGFYVEDLGSSNGTYVNGEQVQRHTLKDGDEILIGKYQILYSDDKLGERPPSTDNGEKPGKDTVAGPAIEGSLNTMETNSDQIRKRMEEMQKQKSGESATAQETVVTRTGPSPALIVAAIIGLLVLAFLALVLM